MALIQVTPDVLRGKAADIRNYKGEHDEVMSKIRTLVNGLNEVWQGDAQKAFVAKFESMQPTFTQFSEMLEGYAKLMETSANQIEQTDQQLSSAINNA